MLGGQYIIVSPKGGDHRTKKGPNNFAKNCLSILRAREGEKGGLMLYIRIVMSYHHNAYLPAFKANDRRFPNNALTHIGSDPSRTLPIIRISPSEAGANAND